MTDRAVKLKVSLPYLQWRDGRPRWQPNARLGKRGWQGEDLRHPDGTWYSLAEAESWVRTRMADVAARKLAVVKAVAAKRKIPVLPARSEHGWPLAEAAEDWIGSMEQRLETELAKGLTLTISAATVRNYRQKLRWLLVWDRQHPVKGMPPLGATPLEAFSVMICADLYERLRLAKGDAMSAGVMRALSALFSWAIRRKGIRMAGNPCFRLAMHTPAPRLRAGSPAEIAQLVAVADLTGLPEVGDMVLLAVWTGQRQTDRLALTGGRADDRGRVTLRQSKTGARVSIPHAQQLQDRLAAIRERHVAAGHDTADVIDLSRHVVRSTATGAALKADYYRKLWSRVLDAAVNGIPDKLPPMPSLAGFRDQDLRDTAVTWHARAGCNLEEIRAITGHSRDSILSILKHYIADHDSFADAAIGKLERWYAEEAMG